MGGPIERRRSFLMAALLTGIPFSAIHMPLKVITGEVHSAADFAAGFGLLMALVIFVRSLLGMFFWGGREQSPPCWTDPRHVQPVQQQ